MIDTTCPACGHHNALLPSEDQPADPARAALDCRDCGHAVEVDA